MISIRNGIILLSWLSAVNGRVFIDDKNIEHTTELDKPTVVFYAHQAVTMGHYGLKKPQLLGTYGEWAIGGSGFNLTDKANLGPDDESELSLVTQPTLDEMKLLQSVVNLSPDCGAQYCTEFDFETFKLLDPDFIIMNGYKGGVWAVAGLEPNITEFMGKPIIYREISTVGLNGTDPMECSATDSPNDRTDGCYGRSLLDFIDDNFELAEFLNLDIPDSLNDDRAMLCEAAENFQANMKTAQDKGIRTMAGYLSSGTSYLANPTADPVLRMFEELGMPILHPGETCITNATSCTHTYFWEYVSIDKFKLDSTEPLYPVDFWLYDHRITAAVTDPDFAKDVFPDKALQANQLGSWPNGGRLITPFHAAAILNDVGPAVAAAGRIYPSSNCIDEVDVTGTDHRSNGLKAGERACFADKQYHNSMYYSECAVFSSASSMIVWVSGIVSFVVGFSLL